MAYKKTIWVNDQTPLNADNMNNIEDGIAKNEEDIEGLPDILLDKGTASGTDTKQVVYNSVQFMKTVRVDDFENIKDMGGINLDNHIRMVSHLRTHYMTVKGPFLELHLVKDSTNTSVQKTLLEARTNLFNSYLGEIPVTGYYYTNNALCIPLTIKIAATDTGTIIRYVDKTGSEQETNLGTFGSITFTDTLE